MSYAIVTIGGKQHRVREGERLLVDRLPHEEGASFELDLLLVGGDGETLLGADELEGQQVKAKLVEHLLGRKVIIGKHRRRTGYRRRNGFRPRLSRIEIESIGKKRAAPRRQRKPATEGVATEATAAEPKKPTRRRSPATKKKSEE